MLFDKSMGSKIIGTIREQQSSCQASVDRFLDDYAPQRSQKGRYDRIQMTLSKQ